jgi:hypothetical protein
MDPRVTEIYGQDPHSVGWWVAFLTVAVVLTFVLIGIFLIGVTKAYETSDEEAPAPEPLPLDGPDDTAAPAAVGAGSDTHLTGVG